MSLEIGSEIELEIDSLAAGGEGVGRFEGLAVFVPLSAPLDRVRAQVREIRSRYARADIVEVLRPGPGRREPPCRYFGRCGGCTWMHLDDAEQERARKGILRDALVRIGGRAQLPPVEWIPSGKPLGYRSRARIAYAEGRVGFRAHHSHQVVDVESCLVLDEETQSRLRALRARPPDGRGELEIRGFGARALDLRLSPRSFAQPNGTLWARWSQAVAAACGEGRLAVELYAGAGFYTVELERAFTHVVAVERSSAARDLQRNTSAEVFHTSAERFAMTRLAELHPDVVLLNPPRAGCDQLVIDVLRGVAPPSIVYVSCDPATLARDLSRLGDAYRVQRVVAIDALPQTHHVEAFVVLIRLTVPETPA